MHTNPTTLQVSLVKAPNLCRLHGGIHAALSRRKSNTSVRRSRGRLSSKPAKQLKFALGALTLSKTNQAAGTRSVPGTLRKYVAHVVLQSCKRPVHVYILGASHVSRQSCSQTAQLISTTKPDIVLLELCKDRVDLLVDPSRPAPKHWHSRVVKFNSSFAQQSTGTACKKLLARLRCRPGRPFSAYDIEQDCIQLLSSGLFASVTPVTQPATLSDAPMFVHDGIQVLFLLSHICNIPQSQMICYISASHEYCCDMTKHWRSIAALGNSWCATC